MEQIKMNVFEERFNEIAENGALKNVKTIGGLRKVLGCTKLVWSFAWNMYLKESKGDWGNSSNYYLNLSCVDLNLKATGKNIILVFNILDENKISEKENWKINSINYFLEGELKMSENTNINTNEQGVILNYTPHTVNIIDQEGNKIQDFPSQGEARCKQETTQAGRVGSIPITSTSFGEVTGLPEEQKNTYYIVSRLIRQALPERQDLLVPNEMVRDDAGRIVGCKSLANN